MQTQLIIESQAKALLAQHLAKYESLESLEDIKKALQECSFDIKLTIKQKKVKSKSDIKKPQGASFRYVAEQRALAKEKGEKVVSKELFAKWNKLNEKQKQKYKDAYALEMKEYKKKVAESSDGESNEKSNNKLKKSDKSIRELCEDAKNEGKYYNSNSTRMVKRTPSQEKKLTFNEEFHLCGISDSEEYKNAVEELSNETNIDD